MCVRARISTIARGRPVLVRPLELIHGHSRAQVQRGACPLHPRWRCTWVIARDAAREDSRLNSRGAPARGSHARCQCYHGDVGGRNWGRSGRSGCLVVVALAQPADCHSEQDKQKHETDKNVDGKDDGAGTDKDNTSSATESERGTGTASGNNSKVDDSLQACIEGKHSKHHRTITKWVIRCMAMNR